MSEELLPSFNEQLRRLPKGSSIGIIERAMLQEAADDETVLERLARMRGNINAQVSRFRKTNSGSNFRVESAATLTSDGEALLAIVSITRL